MGSTPVPQYAYGQTKLTPFQEQFCKAYIESGSNATKAYMAVCKKTRRTADKQYAIWRSNHLLRYPLVKARIEELQSEVNKRHDVKLDTIIDQLHAIVTADPRKVAKWDSENVTLIPSSEISDDAAASIAELSQTQSGVKVKHHSKLEAANLLLRYLGAFKEKVEVTGADGKPLIPENAPDDMEVARFLGHLLDKQARIAGSVPLATIDIPEESP